VPTPDRPLTDVQERALIALRDYNDTYGGDAWHKPQGTSKTTLEVLERLGFVRVRTSMVTEVARITDEGRALLAGMGD
jgi:DNA-binding PadR family transcriptional regulator